MLVADGGFVLHLPHQHVDKVRVFDNDGNLFKHVLEADAGLLQTGDAEIEEVKKKGREDAERTNDMNCNALTSFSNISMSEKVRMGML